MYVGHRGRFWFSIVRIQGIGNDWKELNSVCAYHEFRHVSIAMVYIDHTKSVDILYHLKHYVANIMR